MAMKLGSLYVTLDANASGLVRGITEALRNVERFAKEVKRAAKDVSEVAAGLTALGGAAMGMAAQVNGPAAAAMDDLKRSTEQLAVPIAKMLIPAVKELSAWARQLAVWIDGLDPAVKRNVARFAEWTLGITVFSAVAARVAGAVSGLAGALSTVLGAIGAIGVGPLVGIVAAVAAIAAGVALLHKAWRENWGEMRDVVGYVFDDISTWWNSLSSNFVSGLREWEVALLTFQKEIAIAAYRWEKMKNGGTMPALVEAQFKNAMDMVDLRIEAIRKGDGGFEFGAKKLVREATDLGKAAGVAFVEEWGKIFDELGISRFKSKGGQLAQLQTKDEIEARKQLDPDSLKYFTGSGLAPTVGQFSTSAMRATMPNASVAAIQQQQFGQMSREITYRAKLAQALQQALERAHDFAEGLKLAGQMVMSRAGDAGSIIENAMRGFEQGGAIGAAIAVLADFATRTKAFADLIGVATSVVGSVTQALEPAIRALVTPLGAFTEALGGVLAPIFASLVPLFGVVGSAVHGLAPILWVVGQLFSVLAPALELLVIPLRLAFSILQPFLVVLYEVLRIVGMGLLTIVSGLLNLWNGFVSGIASIVDQVVSLITLGAVKNGGDFLRAMTASTSGVDAALEALKNANYDATAATLDNAAAQSAAAAAVDQFSRSLTNVPSGFKVAAAEFGAMSPLTAGFSLGATATASTGSVVIENVTVQADDPKELADQLRREAKKENFRRTGNPHIYQRPGGDGVP